jgi:hypothetical protein
MNSRAPRWRTRRSTLLAACGIALATVAAFPLQDDAPRSAAEILRDLDSVEWPGFISDKSEEELSRFVKNSTDTTVRLVEELRTHYPTHPRLPVEQRDCWSLIHNVYHDDARILEETARVLETATGKLASAAAYSRATVAIESPRVSFAQRLEWVDDAVARDPVDGKYEWRSHLLLELATSGTPSIAEQRKLLIRLFEADKKSEVADDALRFHKALKHVGKPLDWRILKALTDNVPSADEIAGKEVVLAFLSVWGFGNGDGGHPALAELESLMNAKPAPEFVFVAVATDSDEEALGLAAKLEARGMAMPVIHDSFAPFAVPDEDLPDPESVPNLLFKLGLQGRPWFLRIDEDGVLQRISKMPGPVVAD